VTDSLRQLSPPSKGWLRWGWFLLAALTLAACAPFVPTEPGILALPGTGKNLEQFQADDAECRRYAGSRITPAADAASYDVQRRYDAAYVQCMYSKGHKVPVSGGYTATPGGNMPPPGYVPLPGANPPPGAAPPPAVNMPPAGPQPAPPQVNEAPRDKP